MKKIFISKLYYIKGFHKKIKDIYLIKIKYLFVNIKLVKINYFKNE